MSALCRNVARVSSAISNTLQEALSTADAAPKSTHIVVSVNSRPLCPRTALAHASGPCCVSRSRHPLFCLASMPGMTGRAGWMRDGGAPTAPGWDGPFTTCRSEGTSHFCVLLPLHCP